jgi:hypothetical protein
MQFTAHQSNQEIVVVGVQAVAGQSDVVSQICFAVGSSNDPMLTKYRILLLRR